MEKHLYFVRHGESNSNVDGVMRGIDSILTDKGHKEAAFVAERMTHIGVDAVIASTYPRAIQTATPIVQALGLSLETNDLLIERRSPSAFRNKSQDAELKDEVQTFQARYCEDGYVHSDEETLPQMRERSLAALRFLEEHPATRICVVTHGIFLHALFCALYEGPSYTGKDFQKTWKMATHNTGISYIRRLEEGHHWERDWHIVSWNDLAHLG
ncbi:MAG TPA: histidine phosphatase family protein [Candidatus Paceibacterota bacterium]|nr:histidine phosphatase family protein [Candidatus Paceibacterota bacterium]